MTKIKRDKVISIRVNSELYEQLLSVLKVHGDYYHNGTRFFYFNKPKNIHDFIEVAIKETVRENGGKMS